MALFVCIWLSKRHTVTNLYFQLYSHLGKSENWRQKDCVTGLIRQGQVKSHSSWQHTWTFNYALHRAIKSLLLLHCPTESTCYWGITCSVGSLQGQQTDYRVNPQVGNYNWSIVVGRWNDLVVLAGAQFERSILRSYLYARWLRGEREGEREQERELTVSNNDDSGHFLFVSVFCWTELRKNWAILQLSQIHLLPFVYYLLHKFSIFASGCKNFLIKIWIIIVSMQIQSIHNIHTFVCYINVCQCFRFNLHNPYKHDARNIWEDRLIIISE